MTARVERSFRGISERLAVRYLTNLGGEQVDEETVEGDGWTATISSESVGVGPSLTLTEVTVVFEAEEAGGGADDTAIENEDGDATDLESLVERFAQKAMRAGG